jgi:hypothetical protein
MFALSSRSKADKDCNPLEKIAGGRSMRAVQLDFAEAAFSKILSLLAKIEQMVKLCKEYEDFDLEINNIPCDVMDIIDLLTAKGRKKVLRSTEPWVVAIIHSFLNRRSENSESGKLALEFMERFHNKKESWIVPWNDEYCEKAVSLYWDSSRHSKEINHIN